MVMVEHPGFYVRSVLQNTYGLSITDAADKLGIGRPALSKVLNGKASISCELALKLEHHFDFCAETLVHLQAMYDLDYTRTHKGFYYIGRAAGYEND